DFGILKNERKSHTRDGSRQHNALAVPLFLANRVREPRKGERRTFCPSALLSLFFSLRTRKDPCKWKEASSKSSAERLLHKERG
ncbi:MAG: hypothetical protein H9993_08180, partial [Candidatus Desulfovibrio faecigallinarum]|nr:hypothetical protein [Candidatus Desulfovibrio faecigallinarum]